MTKIVLAILAMSLITSGYAQTAGVKKINKIVNKHVALEPLYFLSSDKLMGRSPKSPEIHVAANYIADQLKSYGVKKLTGLNDYFQSLELRSALPPATGSLSFGDQNFSIGTQLLQIGGRDVSMQAPIVFAGFGNADDLEKMDVKGKIVLTHFGINDSSKVSESFAHIREKESLLLKKGAIAMIENFWQKDVPWSALQHVFGQERSVSREDTIPVFLLHGIDSAALTSLTNPVQSSLVTSGNSIHTIPAKNIVGWVEGTDRALKNQYIALSAHYDHIGVSPRPQESEGKMDSIYNGARDNAVGTAAVLNAARYFSKHPPKRSVLFLLYTAEEMGLLGSRYFAEHPPVPLNRIVYNLNCDNGGYNDTTIVTVIGLGRTSADDDIQKAAKAYGVTAIADPVPELNLFDRSDNLNLALKGIPAPTFGMGVTAFDSTIRKYYHQLADEVSSFNLRYAMVYIRSYVLAARNIANNPLQPTWKKGDKYEAAWKRLYGAKEKSAD